jgi:hypothetical protein
MPDFVSLDNDQARQLIDAQQLFAVYRAARTGLATTFGGTMRWRSIAGAYYLVKKTGGKETSLGRLARPRPRRRSTPSGTAATGCARARRPRWRA